MTKDKNSWPNSKLNTVCPGSSDPPEKIFNIFASRITPFINYYDTLG